MKTRKFKKTYYVRIYEYSREGMSFGQIADALGVTRFTLRSWRRGDPAVADAIRRGRSFKGQQAAGKTFMEYAVGTLPPDLRVVWKEMEAAHAEEDFDRCMELMSKQGGKRDRQHLFVYAMIGSNWNAAEACRKVGVSYSAYEKWRRTDPEFCDVLRHVHEAKKDFCEGALMNLVASGDTAAVVFANKTLNRDRGYDQKVTVEHVGEVTHKHVTLDNVLKLLSVPAKREVLKVVDQLTEGHIDAQALPEHVEDAEYEEVEQG